jgi:hypothetical protein
VCPVVTTNIQFGRQPPVQAVGINCIRTAWYDAGVRTLVAPSYGREYGDLSATGWVAVLRLTGGVPPAELVRCKQLFSVNGPVQSRKFSAPNFMKVCPIVFATGQRRPVSSFPAVCLHRNVCHYEKQRRLLVLVVGLGNSVVGSDSVWRDSRLDIISCAILHCRPAHVFWPRLCVRDTWIMSQR